LDDAESFLKEWGTSAHGLGWSAVDVFGAHPTHPVNRYDYMGLIWCLHGGQVLAMTERSATFKNKHVNIQTYRRVDIPDAVPIWLSESHD